MTLRLRAATAADAEAVCAIYAPSVAGSIISFEEVVPTADEMAQRITAVLARHPWLVAEDGDGSLLGYAYAGAHRERAAYRWTVEASVYVAPAAHRRGVGTGLYTALHEILTLQGFTQSLAGIALPNPASVALHRRFGYDEVARYRAVGHKLGSWIDVVWLQRTLAAPDGRPTEPVPFPELAGSDALGRCLRPV